MIRSHARERLPGESFNDYKVRRAWSNRVLATAIALRPTESPQRTRFRRPARDTAPQFVEAMFGTFAQQLVNDMRNGRLRAY